MYKLASVVLAGAAAVLVGPACGSSPTTPTPPAACVFQVSASSQSFGPGGGSTTVTITTASGCTWTVTANETWVSFGSPATGSGTGTVNVTVAPNSGPSSRQCALSVGGQSVSLSQAGQPAAACDITLTPATERFDATGDRRTFAVSTRADCTWTAVTAASWLAVTSGAAGQGPGTVGYAVEAWSGPGERTGTIGVGQAQFIVRQDPPAPAACAYSVTPIEFSPCMRPATLSAAITTEQGCTWTAAPGASWIAVTSGASGSGPGVVTFQVSENYDAPRQGVVEVRWPTPTEGQNLQVQQAGCLYAVSTAGIAIAAAGGSGRFDVIQQSVPIICGGATQDACVWTAQSDVPWITITTSMPQAGDNPVLFSVAPNASASPRTGTITVRDTTVRITQAGI